MRISVWSSDVCSSDLRGHEIEARTGLRLQGTRIAVRDVGKARSVALPSELLTTDARSIVDDPDIDVIVEVIGGMEPARELILAALKAGKPVITGNKELLANAGAELFEAAESERGRASCRERGGQYV